MKELIEAVNKVMTEVSNIEKNLDVGGGRYSYKGVADKDVKEALSKSMVKNGLAIFPTGIKKTIDNSTWEENSKLKRSVFTEVETTYKLYHTSGQFIELAGYGQGIDTGDKAAGKATTYAMKYTLLYTFMVATGKIDDADNTHSNDYQHKNIPMNAEQHATYVKRLTNATDEEKAKIVNELKAWKIAPYSIPEVYYLKLKELL